MSSDEDAEELAELRAQRAARQGGVINTSLAQLRERQQKEEAQRKVTADFYVGGTSTARPLPADEDDEDEDAPVVVDGAVFEEEPELLHEELRSQFPMGFGKQEEKVEKPQDIHGKHLRPGPAIGPPRPPPKGPAVGPPRPPVGPPRPPASDADVAAGDGDEEVGPARPPGDDDDDDHDGDDDEDEEDQYQLPITHEVVLGGASNKAVVALDLDHTGSRLIAGSLDYGVKMYDFNGMKADLRPFRGIEPQEGHPVHALSWSPTGDGFLSVTGAATAKIFDRDGRERGEFKRGDMYLRDMKNTAGHISSLCGGQWHPTDKTTVMTCSEDGTVRIWDAVAISQKVVVKPSLSKPVRTAVTACTYSGDGKLLAAALMDGTIQCWDVKGKFGSAANTGVVAAPKAQMLMSTTWSFASNPKQIMRGAHQPSHETTCLNFAQDGQHMLSRCADGTMKLWDLRRFNAPLHSWDDLPTHHTNTKALFSPDDRFIVTGVAAGGEGDEGGAVVFFDRRSFSLVRKLGMPANVVALAWHHRLNQIFVGIGDRKAGSTHVLYDTTWSERGVMQAVSKAPRKADPLDFHPALLIKTPHALPMFREEGSRKRQREKNAADPVKSRKPDPGDTASSAVRKGGLGATGGTLLTQHLLKQRGKLINVETEKDPRESILRHANKKDAFSELYNRAYKETQPVPIYAPVEDEDDEHEEGKDK